MELEQLVSNIKSFLLEEHNEDGTHVTSPASTISEAGMIVGTIVGYGGTADPSTSWLICDGRALSRSTYATLYTAIGTAFGTGDAATTFNIPDYRGKFVFGKATSGSGSTLGTSFGSIDHLHTGPSHTHTGPSHTHSISADGTGATGAPSATTEVQSGTGATVASSTHTHTGPSHTHSGATGAEGTGATGSAGAGSTGTENPPGLPINMIILVS